jgi:hypothetical protein
MALRLLVPCLAVLALLQGGVAGAAEPDAIQLQAQPALGPHLAAFPRIAAAQEPAAQRVNQALAAADARLLAAVKDCRAQAKADPVQADDAADPWERTVTVAMRGPRYLALVVGGSMSCGGAHPDVDEFALAYDLRTGLPLNWARLLPKTVAGTASLTNAADGTRLGVVASPTLTALYVKLLKPEDDCAQALQDSELQFMLWPDAAHDGVTMAPADLPHVIVACGDDVTIPLATLRTLGADPALLAAIEAGHQAGLFEPVK